MNREHITATRDTRGYIHAGLGCAFAFAAAVLVPAAPAAAQEACGPDGGVCGFVWNDTNNDGIQDPGEPGLSQVKVFLSDMGDGEMLETETDADGFYYFVVGTGSYQVSVKVPANMTVSPHDQGGSDDLDSDGVFDGLGYSVAPGFEQVGEFYDTTNNDFGLHTPDLQADQPGTGTPGYWKTHPEAWPVESITVGGVTYTKTVAISWLNKVGKDKTTTMFSSLVPAMLNVLIGNHDSCVASTIAAANAWMADNPVGSKVWASSDAWAVGEPLHQHMDAYNNGLLCAPHRN